MTEKELIEQIQSLKQIKPSKEWVDFVFLKISSLKNKPEVIFPYKVKTVKFSSFLTQYRIAFAGLALCLVFISSMAYAQNTLPGSLFYPLKTLSQNIRIALTPVKEKPVVKLEIAKERLKDLSKVKINNQEIIRLADKLRNEINSIPEEIQKLEKKKVVLDVSLKIKEQNEELKKLVDKSLLDEKAKNNLSAAIKENQGKVLSLINETSEIINNCPTYLEEKINNLKKYFFENESLINWTPEEIIKVRTLLTEIEKFMKAGNCLEAIEKIESIEKLMKIHSLEVNLEVETSTPSF
ncbi:MAG: DUF5667 domain-containing protein [Minisyncoccia bacterium]